MSNQVLQHLTKLANVDLDDLDLSDVPEWVRIFFERVGNQAKEQCMKIELAMSHSRQASEARSEQRRCVVLIRELVTGWEHSGYEKPRDEINRQMLELFERDKQLIPIRDKHQEIADSIMEEVHNWSRDVTACIEYIETGRCRDDVSLALLEGIVDLSRVERTQKRGSWTHRR